MDKKRGHLSTKAWWFVAGAIVAAALLAAAIWYGLSDKEPSKPAPSAPPSGQQPSSGNPEASAPTESSDLPGASESTPVDSKPATPVEPSDNTPQLYNPDGTPELPTTDPNRTSFQIPGFTALENAPIGDLDGHIRIAAVGLYSGPFFEDGGDEEVEQVLALIVENTTDEVAEFTQVEMQAGEANAVFRVSALPAGSCCLVLENSALSVQSDTELAQPKVTQYAPLRNAVLDYSDDFQLYPADGVINIRNCSGHDFENDIYVYYKNYENGVYMGGIAYRASFTGGLKNEAIGQSIQRHFESGTSVILYMNYEA